MKSLTVSTTESLFDSIRHTAPDGSEFWLARELQKVLGYAEWRKFEEVVRKAMQSCKASSDDSANQFGGADKLLKSNNEAILQNFSKISRTIVHGSGAKREIDDYRLSRYACYLIAQNGDPRKKKIALAQSYFAVKTREREIEEAFSRLSEDGKRVALRGELRQHNKSLADAAHNAGVVTSHDYAAFQNAGYKGLYDGLTMQGIQRRKGLKKSQQILDHMGSEELAANLFRATQTDAKLRRENIQGKDNANAAHNYVGRKVRQTIKELGGTMPEDLPTPEKSIKQLEREQKKLIATRKDEKPDN